MIIFIVAGDGSVPRVFGKTELVIYFYGFDLKAS